MIRLTRAGVRFGDRWIFRDVHLTVARGTSVALLGPNGRGKTTLIRAATGMQPLTEGDRDAPTLIGYVPQVGGQLPPYRVLDLVVMGRSGHLGIFRSPSHADFATARAALDEVEIAHLAEAAFVQLSGGERQLVMLARAVATRAETIVLDEPASALDLANQNRFLVVLDRLRRTRRYAILFSTHIPQHALTGADETVMMMSGLETLTGPTATVMTEPNVERLYGMEGRLVEVEKGISRTQAFVPLFVGGNRETQRSIE